MRLAQKFTKESGSANFNNAFWCLLLDNGYRCVSLLPRHDLSPTLSAVHQNIIQTSKTRLQYTAFQRLWTIVRTSKRQKIRICSGRVLQVIRRSIPITCEHCLLWRACSTNTDLAKHCMVALHWNTYGQSIFFICVFHIFRIVFQLINIFW